MATSKRGSEGRRGVRSTGRQKGGRKIGKAPLLVFVNKVLLECSPFVYVSSLVAFVITAELTSCDRL